MQRSEVTCSYPYDKCLNTSVKTQNEQIIVRGCSSSLNPLFQTFTGRNATFLQINKCETIGLEDGTFEYCICNQTLCNSTSKSYPNLSHKLLSFIFVIIGIIYLS
ncbi:Hypothetical protein SRAE_1000227600 [Strongyloides ratti]|uniref:Protein quiver n=1 Tax=Strongyloides ratti TaxID=34506 RepID=A0A090L915_STRRB|nr:Hypothetical protein SRAE_1000227600 [Strongyloides ratti]CEF64020.1 Hypothetical protein SRAE_1000227600 [Strongyloides ratti]